VPLFTSETGLRAQQRKAGLAARKNPGFFASLKNDTEERKDPGFFAAL
jgi:hypothetical protein